MTRAYNRLRRFAESVLPLVTILGTAATIWLGYVAFQIEQEVQARSEHRARVDRAVAIAQGVLRDADFRRLQRHALDVEADTRRAIRVAEHDGGALEWNEALARVNALNTGPESYAALKTWMQQARRISLCLDPDTFDANGDRETLCDTETVAIMLHDAFADLFFLFRPILFCDQDGLATNRQHVQKVLATFGGMDRSIKDLDRWLDGVNAEVKMAWVCPTFVEEWNRNVVGEQVAGATEPADVSASSTVRSN